MEVQVFHRVTGQPQLVRWLGGGAVIDVTAFVFYTHIIGGVV